MLPEEKYEPRNNKYQNINLEQFTQMNKESFHFRHFNELR